MNKEDRQRIEDQELLSRTNKLIIDMKHDLNKEHHWDEQIAHREERAKAQDRQYNERAKAQDKQWRFQRLIWVIMGILTGMAIIANAYVRTHPENFMPQPVVKTIINEVKK